MRPESVVMFERLFLLSLALSAGTLVVGYDDMMRAVLSDPSMRQLGFGSGLIIGMIVASFAVYLLLWWLIARRASSVAKWTLVVFVALGLVSLPAVLAGPMSVLLLLNLAVYALEVAAVVFLFRADAKAWFRGEPRSDATTFD
ncbi:MAG TPA: hypothetical protein VFS49_11850 [Croceibacterium sp.]|nr:hypothetical protein [Croceibacterium sp.]